MQNLRKFTHLARVILTLENITVYVLCHLLLWTGTPMLELDLWDFSVFKSVARQYLGKYSDLHDLYMSGQGRQRI